MERLQPPSILSSLGRIPWLLVLLVCLLAAVGVASLYSVADGSMQPWAERHASRFLLALSLMLAVAVVPLRVWAGLAIPSYLAALALLALVPVLGTEAMGARRWLQVGDLSVQPAEIMKIALIAALARYYHLLPADQLSRPRYVGLPLIAIAVPVLLTLRQPDLGTAMVFATIGLGLMFLAGVSWWYFIGGAAGLLALLPWLWGNLHDYQRRRIEVFLDADRDPLGAGYHIAQSKIALGSGGITGKGFRQGTQAALDFLPEKHTDFIFTMFAEEWGFAGSIGLIALYALLVVTIGSLALASRSIFGRLLIGGVALIVFLYAFINVAMVTGLLPVVGVPLPLVSYGGTSMMTVMLGIGLAMSAHIHRDRPLPAWGLGRWA